MAGRGWFRWLSPAGDAVVVALAMIFEQFGLFADAGAVYAGGRSLLVRLNALRSTFTAAAACTSCAVLCDQK